VLGLYLLFTASHIRITFAVDGLPCTKGSDILRLYSKYNLLSGDEKHFFWSASLFPFQVLFRLCSIFTFIHLSPMFGCSYTNSNL